LRICLFDALGRLRKSFGEVNDDRGEARYILTDLPKGIYFLTVRRGKTTEAEIISHKLILK
jgi:hypothetical protein